MSSTDKRAAGVSYCALLMVVIFEGVAIIAALVAITGTFWLGAPSFFSRPTLPPSFADPDLLPPLVRRRPARHREGFCAPRRQERGALGVCYTNPEMPNLLDANTTLEEVMASSETFGLSTVVALGARDAAATDRVASDAPAARALLTPTAIETSTPPSSSRISAPTSRTTFPSRESPRRGALETCDSTATSGATTSRTRCTRRVRSPSSSSSAVRSRWSTSSSVRCAAAPTAEEARATSPSSRFSRLGRMAGLPVDPHQHLRLGRVAPRRRHRRVQNRSRRGRRRAELLGPLVLALPGRNGSHHARRDIQMLLIAPRKTPSLAEVPRRSRE